MAIIPFKSNDAVIVVNVLVRGSRNSKFIKMVVDTGASITSIPSEIALSIGVDPSFLGFSLKNVEIACLNLPPQSTVSGLLGLNILRRFNLSFKFRESLLEIN